MESNATNSPRPTSDAAPSTEPEGEAERLTQTANDLIEQGKLDQASKMLEQSKKLYPSNPNNRTVLLKLQERQHGVPILSLIRNCVSTNDIAAGETALESISGQKFSWLGFELQDECLRVLFPRLLDQSPPPVAVRIYARLLGTSHTANSFNAGKLVQEPNHVFTLMSRFWDAGVDPMFDIPVSFLATPYLPGYAEVEKCRVNVFSFLLSKLKDSDFQSSNRALLPLSRYLGHEVSEDNRKFNISEYSSLVEPEDFINILKHLNLKNPYKIRGQATFAAATLLGISESRYSDALRDFMVSKVLDGGNENINSAFAAAASLLPIAPSISVPLFLSDGFLPSLVPFLRRPDTQNDTKHAALKMLSSACVDKSCREAVVKTCLGWIQEVVKVKDNPDVSLAALALAKIYSPGFQADASVSGPIDLQKETEYLTDIFIEVTKDEDVDKHHRAYEGLALVSLHSHIKEKLVDDREFLKRLKGIFHHFQVPTLMLGTLSVLAHLTALPPTLSEEAQKLQQLKAYANASKESSELHPLELRETVLSRCQKLIDVKIASPLINRLQQLQKTPLILALKVLVSLSAIQSARSQLVQQGAVSALLYIMRSEKPYVRPEEAVHDAKWVVARLLISTNPLLIFPHTKGLSMSSTAMSICSLLKPPPSDGPRDLLPTFEVLLALTNLAGADEETRDKLISHCRSEIGDLMLSNNTRLQCAAVELVCNLVQSPKTIVRYAENNSKGRLRVKVLAALTDVEDAKTREAAGGAFATLTQFEEVVENMMAVDGAMEKMVKMCSIDESIGLQHRGAVCLNNIALLEGETASKAKAHVIAAGGLDVLATLAERCESPEVRDLAKQTQEALR